MRYFSISIILILVTASHGQQPPDHRYVIVPPDQGLILVVPQSNSPIKFEDPKLLVDMEGRWTESVDLRNQSKKPIRAYKVAVVAASEWCWQAPDDKHLIMPGQLAPPDAGPQDEIIPLTDELRGQLKLRGSMKVIHMLMVVRVEFNDGTVFEDKNYDATKDYLERLYTSIVLDPSS